VPKGRAGDIGAPILSTEALDDRIAIVGTAGSGKTYAAKGFVERLLVAGARVTVVDPLGVWWGLRASADGATPGYPVVVFGGRHADVAITAEMGAALGRLIAGQALACVVDLSELGSSAARRRFMAAFADALYEANEEPLHLSSTKLISGRRSGRSRAGKGSWAISRRSCGAAGCAASSRG
jgi:DNA helicase HerA-like ATPase